MSAPKRPRSLDRKELGFDRQEMVRWLSPTGLWHTATKVFLSGLFGQYADKREVEAVFPAAYSDEFDYSSKEGIWIDYMSDTGDGFDSTMSMASLVGATSLNIPDAGELPRGHLLVLGGDEVYPTASTKNYENRFIGPFSAAHPVHLDESNAPHMYALPGNHDWYDGLTSFLRVFAQQKWVGGWKTQQQRSYFAIRLQPHWWLWAIDNQFDTYIDKPQLDYFADAATHLEVGDAVVLCTSRPTWVAATHSEDPEAFSATDYFERKIIRPTGAQVRLWLSGDTHHYAHYVVPEDGTHFVTSGGGGAFTGATHDLPPTIEIPPEKSIDPGKTTPSRTATLLERFPSAATSRKMAQSVGRIPFMNGGFPLFIACAYVAICAPLLVKASDPEGFGKTFGHALHTGMMWAITAILVAALAGFTKRKSAVLRYVLGAPHALAHVIGALVAMSLSTLVTDKWNGTALSAGNAIFTGLFGAVIGSAIFCVYLFMANLFTGAHANEIFSGLHNEGYKNFLRIHLHNDELTVYPIALREHGRDWTPQPDKSPEDAWLKPERPLQPRLTEAPFVVTRKAGLQ